MNALTRFRLGSVGHGVTNCEHCQVGIPPYVYYWFDALPELKTGILRICAKCYEKYKVKLLRLDIDTYVAAVTLGGAEAALTLIIG